jgi:hypothetical protein
MPGRPAVGRLEDVKRLLTTSMMAKSGLGCADFPEPLVEFFDGLAAPPG